MKFKDMPYERVDFDKAERELRALMEEFENAKSGEEQFAVHQKFYELTDRVSTMMTIAHIRYDVDTSDEFYSKEHEYYDEKGPIYKSVALEYEKKMYASPYREYLEKKIGPVAFKNMEIAQKAMDEKLIPLMQEENALVLEYNKLIASAKIEFDGKELNLSLLRPYRVHQDRSVRQAAWKKTSDFYRENAEKLHERRRQRLGLDKLKFYDAAVYFKNGNPAPIGNPDEILAAGQKMYSELSPETKEFYDFMMENELFDVLGRKTKRAGGYMTYMPVYNSPFVFANFNGTSGDVDVITHECGHAFQGYLSGKDPIREHSDIGMETAEIHSMSMEFFTQKWMSLFFGDRAQDYIEMHLEDSAAFIPYGCMVDEFQHIVYENPDMTPAERHAAWLKLEKEYRPHQDYDNDPFYGKGGYWQNQLHVYNYPLYYIDYCLAQTCALQYKVWMDENFEEAWKSYLKLCNLSASDFFTGLLKKVGLNSPFEDGCLKNIIEKLEKYVK